MKLVIMKRARHVEDSNPSQAISQNTPKKYRQAAASRADGVHVFSRPEIPTYLQKSLFLTDLLRISGGRVRPTS